MAVGRLLHAYMIAWMRIGCFQIYILNASENQQSVACIMAGAAPASASLVAPPSCMDWPPKFEPKNFLKRVMKKNRVGTEPSSRSHNGELYGKSWSRDCKYDKKCW